MKIRGDELIGVTGASGFVGRHLVRYLTQKGFTVRALVNRTELPQDLMVEKISGSINDREAVEKFLHGVDILFHLATALGNRLISDRDFFRINREGTANVMEIAAEKGVRRVIHFSSAGVYGKSSGRLPLEESAPKNPIDVYERSKLAGEEAALSYADKTDLIILRPGWVYGEEDRRTFKLIRQIHSGLFFIAGSGKIKHSPIYVRDLVEAAFGAAGKGKKGQIYNVGGEAITVEEMVRTIARTLGKKILPFKVPIGILFPLAYGAGKIFSVFKREAPLTTAKLAFFMRGKPLDSGKIKDELKIDIPTGFAEGIDKTLRWYKEKKWI